MTGPVPPPDGYTPPPPPDRPGTPASYAAPPPPASGGAPPPPPPGSYESAPASGGGKKKGLLVGGIVATMMLGIAGAGAGAYLWLAGGGPQPADAMPETVDVYLRVDADPSANQKVEIYRLLEEIPELKEVLDDNEDLRKSVIEPALENCDGVGWDDVEPWLGDRMGLGIDLDLPEDPSTLEYMSDDEIFTDHVKIYGTAQVSDEDAAQEAFDDIFSGCGVPAEQQPGVAFNEGFAVIAYNQDLADEAVEADGSLSDNAEFTEAMDQLGDPGVVSGWVNAEPFIEIIEEVGPEIFSGTSEFAGGDDFGTGPDPYTSDSSPSGYEPASTPAVTPVNDEEDPQVEIPPPYDEDDPFGDDPFGDDDPWTTEDPYRTPGYCSFDDQAVAEVMADSLGAQFEGIQSFSFAVRAQDNAIELISAAVYDESINLDSSSRLGELPEDTAAGVFIGSGPESWMVDSETMLELMAADACMTTDELRREMQVNTPLDFDQDWETLQNSGFVMYLGSSNLQFLPELGNGMDFSEFDIAGALLSEDGSAADLIERTTDWIQAESGMELNVAEVSGGSAIGSNPGAAEALNGDGGLGGTDAFQQVIPESEIGGGFFINAESFIQAIKDSGESDEFIDSIDGAITAVGGSYWAEDNSVMFSFRIGFDA